ncbi:hypothetical protein LINJ_19_1690 [Leishmania infantum JPCM5]|uniref:Uncharacterized protein n=3 Tax=Leishmania donovani species complex TaxID=38574 RepID=A4HYJ3_LEIIN|nr:hypothetical protein LINJ_19_1690 [Leishmania infantum JPCM5]CAM67377.2 hypothetical protein LINJ_19_1690 [Leishmania infantum JPCM5]|eukprot:XP_001465134.2 hypothetical protein LINJ_19_1690 [Leishmania infantum JPCM5]
MSPKPTLSPPPHLRRHPVGTRRGRQVRNGRLIADVEMPLLTSCAVVSLLLVCVLWRMEDGVELCAVGLVSCFGCRALRMAMRFSLFSLHAFLVLVRAHCPLAYTLLFVAGGLVLHACALLYLSLSLGMRALRSSCPAFPCWQASPSTTPLLREISRNEPPSAKNERNNPDYSSMKPSKRAANLDSRGATSADHSTASSHTEAVPPLTVDTLTVPLVHAECAPATAPLSPGNGLTPTLAECASEAARRPTEAAPVSAVEALPPTPAECASDAAPQKIKMTARKRHATASLHRKRERDGASDSSLWPLHTRRALDPSAHTAAPQPSEAAPVSAVEALPPTPAECASEAAPQPSEAAPVSAVEALPPTPAECASDAVPQPSEAAPASAVEALPPTPAECASEAAPQPSEAAPASAVEALPPTPAECASDAVPQPSEAAPVSAVEALPPTPAECASEAAPQPSEAAPASAVEALPPTPAECASEAAPQPSEAAPASAVEALPPTPAECASEAAPQPSEAAPASAVEALPPTPAECASEAAPQPSEAAPVSAVEALPPTPAECASEAAPQPSEAAPASAVEALPPTPAECASEAAPQPSEAAPVSAVEALPPTPAECASEAAPQPSEAAPVSAVEALPPTPAECASEAAPQPSEAAPASAVEALPPTPAECASDGAPQPSKAAPASAVEALPPTPAECASEAAPQPSEAAPVSAVEALPPTPAECASEAAPQPSEAAPASAVEALPPTPAECASEAAPQPSEAAPASAVEALPPTPAECAYDGAPQPSEAAPVSAVEALPPTPAECASEAAPQPSEAAPASAVEALPPTPAECASDAVPQPSEAAPVSAVEALPPTPAECASEAAPQPSEAAPVSAVEALPPTPAEYASEAAPVSAVEALPPTPAECASEAAPQPSEAAPVSAVEALPPTPAECTSEAAPQPSDSAPQPSMVSRMFAGNAAPRMYFAPHHREEGGPVMAMRPPSGSCRVDASRAAARLAAVFGGLPTLEVSPPSRCPKVVLPASQHVPQASEAAPVSAVEALPPTPAECASDAAPQPNDSAPVSLSHTRPPTPVECASEAAPQPSEAAPVSAVEALPPTPAECASEAAPQLSEAAPVSAVEALPPTPAECASEAGPQPSDSAPQPSMVSRMFAGSAAPRMYFAPHHREEGGPVMAMRPPSGSCRVDASRAAARLAAVFGGLPTLEVSPPSRCPKVVLPASQHVPQASEAAPVSAVEALPPTPAECASDAAPQPNDSAPVSLSHTRPPTPVECASEAAPQPSEAAPVSAVEALPPTPAECTSEAAPQPSDSAPQPSMVSRMFAGSAAPRMYFAPHHREEGGPVMAMRPPSGSCRVDASRAAARLAAVFGGLPTLEVSPPSRCPKVVLPASQHVPQASEAAPVSAVEALPPTPAECASDAAPQPNDSAPVSLSHTRPPTPVECASEAAPQPSDSAPQPSMVSRMFAGSAAPRMYFAPHHREEGGPVMAMRPPSGSCRVDASRAAARLAAVFGGLPTLEVSPPSRCPKVVLPASQHVPQASEAAPVSAVEALPPTLAECAWNAVPLSRGSVPPLLLRGVDAEAELAAAQLVVAARSAMTPAPVYRSCHKPVYVERGAAWDAEMAVKASVNRLRCQAYGSPVPYGALEGSIMVPPTPFDDHFPASLFGGEHTGEILTVPKNVLVATGERRVTGNAGRENGRRRSRGRRQECPHLCTHKCKHTPLTKWVNERKSKHAPSTAAVFPGYAECV